MPALKVTARVMPSILMGRDISTLSSYDDVDGLLGIGHVGDDQGELVATQPGNGGPAGGGTQQALGDLAQQAVTDEVAQRVVDILEAVDVEQHDGHPTALAQGRGGAVEEEAPVRQPGQHVVTGLVRLAVHLVAQFLDEAGPLQARAGVGGQRLEEPEVVLVEAVELLVAVDGDERSDRPGAVGERRHDGVVVFADDRVDVHLLVVGPAVVQGASAGEDRVGHHGVPIEADRLNDRLPFVVEARCAGGCPRARPG